MEIQPPQSVQINFNNKIITLHNVTIVKNPKIITIDATQYTNFLKASPVKLANGTTNTTPIKLQMPSLVPMNGLSPGVKTTQVTLPLKVSAESVKTSQNVTPINGTNIALKASSLNGSTVTFKNNPFMMNQTPGSKQASKIAPQQIFRTVQNGKNGIVHLKPAQSITTATFGSATPFKFQMLPQKQQESASVKPQEPIVVKQQQLLPAKQQQTVIISPPKTPTSNSTPVKFQLKPQTASNFVLAKPLTPSVASKVSVPVTKAPSPVFRITQATPRVTPAAIPTPAIVSPPAKVDPAPKSLKTAPKKPNPPAVPTRVIISPPQKHKASPSSISPPEAKRPCKKLSFSCIFCENVYDDSTDLVNHMKKEHAETRKEVVPVQVKQPSKIAKKLPPQVEPSPAKPALEKAPKQDSEDSDVEDDDESEVNDLIMDLEETQDTAASSQDRSESPESPEFEEHVPQAVVKEEDQENVEQQMSEFDEDDFDYGNYEYFSNILEPICELSCENDSDDGNGQDENEAMRLYREAMEVNYQQNGIKKRGRRKQRKAKPLMENMTSLNGILAGLLDNSIKVPPGPGRGRRKEMNEEELQLDRSNGVCLFSCNKCDESFKYAGDLAKHVRSHTISSPYQCSICQRKFTHIGSLNTHLRIHSGERPYKCNQCDKSFTQSNSLMVHVKSHLSNKPFQCNQCNKGFLNASSLALHTKTHTGPTTVSCPIDTCGKEFRDNNLLEEHMMTHRQSMLYQCSLCSEKFEQSCLLVQHVKSHIGDKPFQCNQCGKCFTQPGSLNTHLRIHTGEKPFECNICGKKFTQASSLSVHMKVHGEKEFKCVVESCKKSYSQEAYLKKHMQKHLEASLNDENNLRTQE